DVTWDRNAPAIALAQRGILSISDGSNRRELELTGAQLRNGRVLYSRLSGDVGLRLEVFPEGRESVSESIRIVAADPAPTHPTAPSVRVPVGEPKAPTVRPAEKRAAVEPSKPTPIPPARVPTAVRPPASSPVRPAPETRTVEAAP